MQAAPGAGAPNGYARQCASYLAPYLAGAVPAPDVATLEAALAEARTPRQLLAVALGFEEAGAPARALAVYERLGVEGDASTLERASLGAAVCAHLAGEDEKAVPRLREFLASYGWTRWAGEARLRLGEALLALERYDECAEALEPLSADAKLAAEAEGIVRPS